MALIDALAEAEQAPSLPDTPAGPLEALAAASGVPLQQVARVLSAFYGLDRREVLRPRQVIGDARADAIEQAAARLSHKLRIARAIADGRPLEIQAAQLIPPEKAAVMCDGCPESVQCALMSLSTPQECRTGRHARVALRVLSATTTHARIETEHPQGVFRVEIKHLEEHDAPSTRRD